MLCDLVVHQFQDQPLVGATFSSALDLHRFDGDVEEAEQCSPVCFDWPAARSMGIGLRSLKAVLPGVGER